MMKINSDRRKKTKGFSVFLALSLSTTVQLTSRLNKHSSGFFRLSFVVLICSEISNIDRSRCFLRQQQQEEHAHAHLENDCIDSYHMNGTGKKEEGEEVIGSYPFVVSAAYF